MRNLIAQRDVLSGIFFICVGAIAGAGGYHYRIGSAAQMGPGYLPAAFGLLLVILGCCLVFRGVTVTRIRVERIHWRPMICVLGSFVWFGATVSSAGLVFAALTSTMIAAKGSSELRLGESIKLSVLLTAMACIVFVVALRLPLALAPIW